MADKGQAPPAPASDQTTARARPIKTLPTDRIQFPKQLDILRAYAAASGPSGKPVTNREISDLVKMVESTISISNAFFTDTGLILKTASGFVPSPDVIAYQRAYEWNPETAAHKLAPTLKATWFGQKLFTRLSFQPLDEETAIHVIAEEAAATKEYRKQVATLLDYLVAAGIASRENGIVRLGPAAGVSFEPVREPEPVTQPSGGPTAGRGSSVVTSFATPTEGVIQFHVSVKVDMGEFKGWAPARITAFFSGIAAVLAAKSGIEEDAAG